METPEVVTPDDAAKPAAENAPAAANGSTLPAKVTMPEGSGFPPDGKGSMNDPAPHEFWLMVRPPHDPRAGEWRHEVIERLKLVLLCAAAWSLLHEFLYRPLNLWQQSWHLLPFAFLGGALFALPELRLRQCTRFGISAGVVCGLVPMLIQTAGLLLGLNELYGFDMVMLGAALGCAAGLGTRYPLAAQWGLLAGAAGGLLGNLPVVWLATGFAKMGSYVSDSGMPFWLSILTTFFITTLRFAPVAGFAGVAVYYAIEYKKVDEAAIAESSASLRAHKEA